MFNKCLHFSSILILLPALWLGFYPGKIVIISYLCMIPYLGFILCYKKYFNFQEIDGKNIIMLFIWYSVFTWARSFWNIDNWRDYLGVCSGFLMLIFYPVWMLLAKKEYLPIIWRSFLTIGIVMCGINYFYPPSDAMMSMAHNMIWLNIFILLYPYIKKRYYLLILILAGIVVFYDLDRRSIMLGYLVPMAILLFYKLLRPYIFRRICFVIALVLPLLCCYLFQTKTFYVFKYIENSSQEIRLTNDTRGLMTDSRTGIYEDVFRGVFDAKEPWKTFIGLGGNGKVRTLSNAQDSFELNGYRSEQESGMLNFIQHGGLLGLFVYSLLLLGSAYRSLFKSNNDFFKMLGYFLLFKYIYSFIEDRLGYTAFAFFLFLWIGMGYNKVLRNMTNSEIKSYFENSLNVSSWIKTLLGGKTSNIEKCNPRYGKNINI